MSMMSPNLGGYQSSPWAAPVQPKKSGAGTFKPKTRTNSAAMPSMPSPGTQSGPMQQHGRGLPGVSSGSGSPGYVQGPGGIKQILKPGETAKVGLGEAYIQGAAPGQTSIRSQIEQAALGDRNQAIAAQGRAQGRFDKIISGYQQGIDDISKLPGEMEGRIDAASKKAAGDFSEAKQMFRDSVSKYEDRGAKDAAAFRTGADSNFETMKNQIMSDPNLPDEVKQAQVQKLSMQHSFDVQRNLTGIFSQVNESLAMLRQNAGGGLASIANSEANTNMAFLQMREGTRLRAEQLKMEGRDRQAQFLAEYPDSAFSMVDTLLQMVGASRVPNANMSGFQF